jgi:hypothetical protein
LQNNPPSNSSVEAMNDVEPNVEIARRAEVHDISGMAFRIGVAHGNMTAHQPQECPDLSGMAFRIGVAHGNMTAHQPQECPDKEAPQPPPPLQSPMTINACVPRQDQNIITAGQVGQDQDKQDGETAIDQEELREASLPSSQDETGDMVSGIIFRIGAINDEVGLRTLKTIFAHQPQKYTDTHLQDICTNLDVVSEPPQSPMTINACVPCQDQDNTPTRQAEHVQNTQHTGAGNDRKRKSKTTVKGPSTYNLGYFTLWWGRMEREGRKDAEDRKCRAEDHAASRGMQMFLGCSKRLKDGRNIPRTEAKTLKTLEQNKSVGMITGRTQEKVPPKNELSSYAYGGKRMLEGGLDSPNKRARVYNDLKDFWGGGVSAQKTSSVKTLSSSITLTSYVHTPRGPRDKLCFSSTAKSDNHLTEPGLTKENVRNGKLSSLPVSKQPE